MARSKAKPLYFGRRFVSSRPTHRRQVSSLPQGWRPRFLRTDAPIPEGSQISFLLELPLKSREDITVSTPTLDVVQEVYGSEIEMPVEEVGPATVVGNVFAKHWLPGKAVVGSRFISEISQERIAAEGFAASENLFSVFISHSHDCSTEKPSTEQHNTAGMKCVEIIMHGHYVPMCVAFLVSKAVLRIFHSQARNSLQFVMCHIQDYENDAGIMFAFSHFMRWMVNQESASGQVMPKGDIFNVHWVYAAARRLPDDSDRNEYIHYLEDVKIASQHITVALRPYQERAVSWMLSRELGPQISFATWISWDPLITISEVDEATSGLLFEEIKLDFNPAYGVYRKRKHSESQPSEDVIASDHGNRTVGRGGLLCDAMGLGKTIELITLVMANQGDMVIGPTMAESPSSGTACCCECNCPFLSSSPLKRRKLETPDSLTCGECARKAHVECSGTTVWSAASIGFVCSNCTETLRFLGQDYVDPGIVPESRATLIVVPGALIEQWRSEIAEHVQQSVNVIVFEGLGRTGYIRQKDLLEADIVLTTYDALGSDVSIVRAFRQDGRTLRHPKRYRATPCPLLSIKWRRLVLDEVQMLGLGTAAEMACSLKSTYRWCVSGTPVSSGLSQMIPMLRFLRIGDDTEGDLWQSGLYEPAMHGLLADHSALRTAVRHVMWRTEKGLVETSDLCLPPQTSQVCRLSFGPVERYHYRSLYSSVRAAVLTQSRGAVEPHIALASELLVGLRQACCHPQVGASGRQSGLSSKVHRTLLKAQTKSKRSLGPVTRADARSKRPLTMEEVLDGLVAKSKLECQDALRVLVAASNGLAGVCLLQHSLRENDSDFRQVEQAIECYRNSLRIADDNDKFVLLDRIQRMHISHNLADALEQLQYVGKDNIRSATPDERYDSANSSVSEVSELRHEVLALKESYIADARVKLHSADENYNACTAIDRNSALSVTPDHDTQIRTMPWWDRALALVLEQEDPSMFVDRVVQTLMRALPQDSAKIRTHARRIFSVMSLQAILEGEIKELDAARQRLRGIIRGLPGSVAPTEAQVAESGQCGNCREEGTGPPCRHCEAEEYFIAVERILYSLRESVDDPHSKDCSDDEGSLHESEKFDCEDFSNRSPGHENMQMHPRLHSSRRNKKKVKSISNAISKALGSSRSNPSNTRNDADLRRQGEMEMIMRSLCPFVRSSSDSRLQRSMDDWFRSLEHMKKEHMAARKVFDCQRELLGCLDEVRMALTRFTLVKSDAHFELLPEHQKMFCLSPSVLPGLFQQFSAEITSAESDFRSKRGSVVYLTSLRKSTNATNSGRVEDDERPHASRCPICLREDLQELAIFRCGHAYCFECTLLMIRNTSHSGRKIALSCPECRLACEADDINFTSFVASNMNPPPAWSEGTSVNMDPTANATQPSSDLLDDTSPMHALLPPMKDTEFAELPSTYIEGHVPVSGSVGSKMEAVVRVLTCIESRFPGAKSLVFSQWTEVLDIVASALTSNRIAHINAGAMKSSSHVAAAVSKFKQSLLCNVLLLPLKRAGAGLNLTEATHVLLVEPSLNPALEAQAVSRVHRIGQTQPSFVHRFIMKGTIEEKIYSIAARRKTEMSNVEETVTAADVATIFADPENTISCA